jgi:hypothetical protein
MLPYLIFIGVTLILLVVFLLLTIVEGKRHVRLFAGPRDRFDVRVTRASFILQHVDWGAFLRDVSRVGFERALHDAAHTTLQAVRFLERVLTRAVRTLRMRRQEQLPAAPLPVPKASRITETVTYLKTTLKTARRAPKRRAVAIKPVHQRTTDDLESDLEIRDDSEGDVVEL